MLSKPTNNKASNSLTRSANLRPHLFLSRCVRCLCLIASLSSTIALGSLAARGAVSSSAVLYIKQPCLKGVVGATVCAEPHASAESKVLLSTDAMEYADLRLFLLQMRSAEDSIPGFQARGVIGRLKSFLQSSKRPAFESFAFGEGRTRSFKRDR